ncbi:hypothetical protein M2322_001180 [Rhodoblastus acidophilus]|uniref:PRC-barrel domain-containing protein n=1 Tax=Rhodoblastus acidophilus TaxID=1074 RepID=UPI002223F470|nr:PRC-barrel domain-containing protein [Rhodoblastus acidophilus]MCW2315646.1 hypothetical protein [Rhodoblastus acidophilus]
MRKILAFACAVLSLWVAPIPLSALLRAQEGAVAPPSEARPAPAQPDDAAPPETPATVLNDAGAVALLGKPVQSLKAEDLGRVVDVITDRSGLLRAAVIDFGGYLGVGARKIAVDWRALHFPEKGGMDRLIADLPRDQLRAAPVYKEGEPIVVLGAPVQPVEAAPAPPKP